MIAQTLIRGAVPVTVLLALAVGTGEAQRPVATPPAAVAHGPDVLSAAVAAFPSPLAPLAVPVAPATFLAQIARPTVHDAGLAGGRGRRLWLGAAVGAAAGLTAAVGIRALVVDQGSLPWYRDRQFYPAAAGLMVAGAGVGLLVASRLR